MIKNPILPGFYPDPSICRVGKDFYMVNSSFSFFPGVPIFHSRDLVNWKQIGHVLNRPSQLPVNHLFMSAGIFAPTIRYNNGTYYMLTTNMSLGVKSFICTAKDPEGPWSEPYYIEGVGGIDPTLFFDDDGKAYYLSTCPRGFGGDEERPIWCCEIDLENMKLVGEPWDLWSGALKDAYAPEGPHIYKKNGWYYLLIAEGGTEFFHSVTISRSKDIHGPFVGYQGNPILTHRHLGRDYPISNVGHGDLVDDEDGNWFMVMLASRLIDGKHKILGRETFIAPVIWEDDWPIVSPGSGKVELCYDFPTAEKEIEKTFYDDFDDENLKLEWNYLGTPSNSNIVRIQDSKLYMKLNQLSTIPWEVHDKQVSFLNISEFIDTSKSLSFIGRRLTGVCFEAMTLMNFSPENSESAGMIVLQNNSAQLRLEYIKGRVQVVRVKPEVEGSLITGEVRKYSEEIIGFINMDTESSYLKIKADGSKYSFFVGEPENMQLICANVDGGFLGSEICQGFVGAYVGMFASSNGNETDKEASFEWFSYENLEAKGE